MAKCVLFEGANTIMKAPEGATDVVDLPAFKDGTQIISCWHLSDAEIENIIKTRCAWLSIKSTGMPPALVSGTEMVEVEGAPSKPVLPLFSKG